MTKINCTAKEGKIVRIDEGMIKDHLGKIVKGTVEETINTLLDADADRLCNAGRYERSEGRKDVYEDGPYRVTLKGLSGSLT